MLDPNSDAQFTTGDTSRIIQVKMRLEENLDLRRIAKVNIAGDGDPSRVQFIQASNSERAQQVYISPVFLVALNDLGSGLVDTTEDMGGSAATFTRATVAWTKLSTGLWTQVASGAARSCYTGANTQPDTAGAYLYLPGTSGNYASTPDSTANSITGDIDIRVKVAMDDWTPSTFQVLVEKFTTANFSYGLYINTNGRPRFAYSILGSTIVSKDATAAPVVSNGDTLYIRVTFQVNDGGGNNVTNFYTSTDGVTWAQLGATITTAAAASIFDGVSSVLIGTRFDNTLLLAGKVYRAQIYNGINGTLAVDFDASRGSSGASTITSGTREVWTINTSGTPAAALYGYSEYGGYFSEKAGIQLVTPSESIRDMTNAAWTATDITAAKDGVGIDGVANSCSRLTCDVDGGKITQTLTAAASSRTYHCFIKRVTGTGTISLTQDDGATSTDITSSINASTFTRVALNASQLNAVFGIIMGTATDVILVDFNQFEAGAFATSPMATAGAVRNADVLTYVFSGNASATEGTAYAELTNEQTTMGAASVAVSFAAATHPLYCANGAPATRISMFDGTTNLDKSSLTSLVTGIRKRASSWGALGQVVTGDGATVATAAFDGNIGSTAIGIGCTGAGGSSFNGTLKNVHIWRTQFPSALLQTITT